MHKLRLTLHVDAFGLVQGGAWEWYDRFGGHVSTTVLPIGHFQDAMIEDAAGYLALDAWSDHERQLRLFDA